LRRGGEAAHHVGDVRALGRYYDAYYGQALKVRTQMIGAFRRAYREVDLLLGATTPTVAFPSGPRRPIRCRCTSPTSSRYRPISRARRRSRSPLALARVACRWGCSSSDRVAARRGCSRRVGSSTRGGTPVTLSDGWEMVVGLEVHTELKTRTKMFCG
ncbi:Amidase signature enzyme, partial [mine drainage metagenome]